MLRLQVAGTLPVFGLHKLVQLDNVGMNDHLQEFAFSTHVLAHIGILFGFFLVDDFDGNLKNERQQVKTWLDQVKDKHLQAEAYLLACQSVKSLFDFGERAFAQLASEQVVSDSFVVRKSGDDLFGRDEKVGGNNDILVLEAILAGIVYIVV